MEWSALDWNTLAIEFYLGLGAERLHEWDTFRLEGDGDWRSSPAAGARPADIEEPRRSGALP